MENIQILKIIGAIYLLLGLGIIINPKYHLKAFKELIENTYNGYFYGMMSLLAGYLLIRFTGEPSGWYIIIPIFGWAALIKGVLFFLAPNVLMNFAKMFIKRKEYLMFMGIIVAIFGAIISYVSFFAL